MKIMTVLGTRPEIIRLSIIIRKLDQFCKHVLVHTGQNFEKSLNEIFFKDLGVRDPNFHLNIKGQSFGEQAGRIIDETEKMMMSEKPDKLLILGDTNSGLSSIPAKKLGIPVYHLEAGNRCYDDRVPEEVNRRLIDHCSDILMPYTHRSKENLMQEGIERKRIFIIGNPIYEVLRHYQKQIDKSKVFEKLKIKKKNYFLVTLHRAENVDIELRLTNFIRALELLTKKYGIPIICSLHPRTKSKMEKFGISRKHPSIQYLVPLGFFDFVALEQNARCVLSDSGTVQEECCILNVPNVTLRDVTERPETIECGSNVISGDSPSHIVKVVELVMNSSNVWNCPSEYLEPGVSDKVIKILFGHYPS